MNMTDFAIGGALATAVVLAGKWFWTAYNRANDPKMLVTQLVDEFERRQAEETVQRGKALLEANKAGHAQAMTLEASERILQEVQSKGVPMRVQPDVTQVMKENAARVEREQAAKVFSSSHRTHSFQKPKTDDDDVLTGIGATLLYSHAPVPVVDPVVHNTSNTSHSSPSRSCDNDTPSRSSDNDNDTSCSYTDNDND